MSRIARLLRGMGVGSREKSKGYCGRLGTATSKLSAGRGDERARPRQRHVDGLGGLAHLPVADAIVAVPLGQVHVDVLLVVAVRPGTEDGHEARAGAAP